jgi:hypothetical protein
MLQEVAESSLSEGMADHVVLACDNLPDLRQLSEHNKFWGEWVDPEGEFEAGEDKSGVKWERSVFVGDFEGFF